MCILIVDDEDIIREFVVEVISEAGFDVKEARAGDDAFKILDGLDVPLSLLFTGIRMPGQINGVALAEHARRIVPGVPIVFATGLPEVPSGSEPFSQPHFLSANRTGRWSWLS